MRRVMMMTVTAAFAGLAATELAAQQPPTPPTPPARPRAAQAPGVRRDSIVEERVIVRGPGGPGGRGMQPGRPGMGGRRGPDGPGGPAGRRGPGGPGGRGSNAAARLLRHREQLELTPDQVKKLEALAQVAPAQVNQADVLRARADLMDATKGDGNPEKARAAMDRMAKLRTDVAIARLKARQDARNVLTPAQKAKVDAMADRMRGAMRAGMRAHMRGGKRGGMRGPGRMQGRGGPGMGPDGMGPGNGQAMGQGRIQQMAPMIRERIMQRMGGQGPQGPPPAPRPPEGQP